MTLRPLPTSMQRLRAPPNETVPGLTLSGPSNLRFVRNYGLIKECLLVLLLTALPWYSYLNSLDGTFVFDDSRISANPAIKLETFSITGLAHAVRGMEPSTRPVANLTFVLNSLVHGFSTRGYHLVNLGIHIAAGLLLYFFLRTIFALPVMQNRQRMAPGIAFASALIWLVHPLQTQAVAYIVQRATSLSTMFSILALVLYARGRLSQSADRRILLLGGCILAGSLAMGSKENAVTLPLFILLYEWFFVQDLCPDWLTRNKKYLVAIGIFLVALPLLFLGDNPWRVLAEGYATRNFSLGERVLTEFRVIVFYLGLLAFPHPSRLSNEHDFALSTSLFHPMTTFPAVVAVLITLALAVALAPRFRFESFCILWFLGNHVVEGSVVPLELVFEHRNYLPSMMAIPLAVTVGTRFIRNRIALSVLLCAVVIFFSRWTYQRNFVWQNEFSLWRDAVAKAPLSARAHNNLAVELESAGKIDEALAHYHETLRIDPGYIAAHLNLGGIAKQKGDTSLAIRHYRQAASLNPEDPELRLILANALVAQGNFAEAKTHYLQAIRLDPENIEARMSLEKLRRKLNARQPENGRRGGP